MNSEIITNLAFIRAKDGKAAELASELQKLVAPTRKEPGSLVYELHRSTEDQNSFFVYEVWENKQALDNHLKGVAIGAFLPKVGSLVEGDLDMRSYKPMDIARRSS